MKALKILAIVVIVLVVVFIVAVSLTPTEPAKVETSAATFQQVDQDTGCTSKYSDDKKADLFAKNYAGHKFNWSGTVAENSDGVLHLRLQDELTYNLSVELEDKKQGYDLEKGQRVDVSFVMESAGGCFSPYRGEHGVIQ